MPYKLVSPCEFSISSNGGDWVTIIKGESLILPMSSEQRSDWITALRSKKYPQGQRVLRDKNDNYCCLGVWADLKDPDAWTPEEREGTPATNWCYMWNDTSDSLIDDVEELPEIVQIMFSTMNDALAWTFDQIADFLQQAEEIN